MITFYISVSVCSLLVTSTLSVKEMVVEKIARIMITLMMMTRMIIMMIMMLIMISHFTANIPGKLFIVHHLKELRNVTQQSHVWEPSMTQ